MFLVLLPVLALLVWHVVWRVGNTGAVRREEAAIRQRGEPLNPAEVGQIYGAVPEADDAAVPLLDLWESESPPAWRAFRNGEQRLPKRPPHSYDPALPLLGSDQRLIPRNQPLSADSRDAVVTFLHEKAAHLESVRAALRRPQARFPLRLGDGYQMLLPHLSELKREAQIFRLEAALATDRGEVGPALAALDNLARLQHLLAEEPLLISQLVRIACGSMLLDSLERLLTHGQLSGAQLDQTEALLERLDLKQSFSFALQAERAFALSAFDLSPSALAAMADNDGATTDDTTSDPEGYRHAMNLLRLAGLLEADRRFLLETMAEAIFLAEQGTPESLERIEELYDDVGVQVRRFPPKIFSGMLLPALKNAALKFAQFEARRRAALMAVAIERYRGEHDGQLPHPLANLPMSAPVELRTDPFDGAPLRFRKFEQGYAVYSVGPDRSDDSGREKPVKTPYGKYDVTVIVER